MPVKIVYGKQTFQPSAVYKSGLWNKGRKNIPEKGVQGCDVPRATYKNHKKTFLCCIFPCSFHSVLNCLFL